MFDHNDPDYIDIDDTQCPCGEKKLKDSDYCSKCEYDFQVAVESEKDVIGELEIK